MQDTFTMCSQVRLRCPGRSQLQVSITTLSKCTHYNNVSVLQHYQSVYITGTSSDGNNIAAATTRAAMRSTPAPPNVVAIALGVVCGVLVLLLLCGGISILALILRNKSGQVTLDKTEM